MRTSNRQWLRIVGALSAVLIAASCTASATTAMPDETSQAQDSQRSVATGATQQQPAEGASADTPPVEPDPAEVDGCRYFDDELLPELESSVESVLAGAALDDTTTDPCLKRFVADGEWVELRFQAADASVVMFGDENLMTNGADTTQAQTSDGLSVHVVASASSPQSISTWDASIVAAFVLMGIES